MRRLSCLVSLMKSHRNLPFFVPHAGCPNCCVFCSQTKITGEKAEKDLEQEIKELRDMLDSCDYGCKDSQIAFFGGSFTAIERGRMVALLETANEYINKGIAQSVRISTRPDFINREILDLLKRYRVTHIELGVQSTNDFVLNASLRGHSARASFEGARLINENNMAFVGQMMIGLPGSTPNDELQTAKDIVKMGAVEARIYPTVVFEGTRLCEMTERGEYTPLDLESAVERTANCFKIFLDAGVRLLRIGLHSSENLKNAPYGANHQSIGELVKSRVYTDLITERAGDCTGQILCIGINKNDISMLRGYNGSAIKRLKEITRCVSVEITACELPHFKPSVSKRSV